MVNSPIKLTIKLADPLVVKIASSVILLE